MTTQCVEWLLSYWIGRMYLTDVESYRELGLGMIIGSVCLIPFCLIECLKPPNGIPRATLTGIPWRPVTFA
jgi:hypothetical protein